MGSLRLRNAFKGGREESWSVEERRREGEERRGGGGEDEEEKGRGN